MRIPISTTQKWYYLRGSEDKDVEYGKIFIAVVAPLSNVSNTSKTTLVVRMRWCFEFSYPDLPSASTDNSEIFASAPNYFSDSSSDWKEGKYLTFKWHEGGNIVEFPGAQAGTIYKVGANTSISYVTSSGTTATTKFAVCVKETTESGLPMLAPMKDLATAQAWAKNQADQYFLPYKSAGPWVTPENPPWHPQSSSVQLLLTAAADCRSPMVKTNAQSLVLDERTSHSSAQQNKMWQTLYGRRGGDRRADDYGLESQAAHAIVQLNETYNTLLKRNDYSPDDPDLELMKRALTQLSRLSFRNLLVEAPLLVWNDNPVRPSTSSSFSDLGDVPEGKIPNNS